ncbi:MAG: hypothetical protein IKQ71_02905 [Lachnospiraceae bacterium]|nr:hypothetical protein [Lachnospiraceae bacterium]
MNQRDGMVRIEGFKKGELESENQENTSGSVVGIYEAIEGGYVLTLPGSIKKTEVRGVELDKYLPSELRIWIAGWKQIAALEKDDFDFNFKVKGARLLFKYSDMMFELYPAALDVTDEYFESISGDLATNIKELGSPYAEYQGMGDESFNEDIF